MQKTYGSCSVLCQVGTDTCFAAKPTGPVPAVLGGLSVALGFGF